MTLKAPNRFEAGLRQMEILKAYEDCEKPKLTILQFADEHFPNEDPVWLEELRKMSPAEMIERGITIQWHPKGGHAAVASKGFKNLIVGEPWIGAASSPSRATHSSRFPQVRS